jgi:FAD/FMN-containing dehydrogenase
MTDKKTQLIGIVSDDAVSDDPVILEGYSKDQSCAPAIKPRFVVRPRDAAQVQALVKWANETASPLVPVSSGPPHSNGDTVPGVAEAVIVDLTGMKAILKIDRRNKIVVVEPGVTYAELGPALAEQGLRMARPLLPRPNKSVLASLIERQPTTIPRLNYSLPEPLRVCGVVWGTGDLAFTGEAGAGPPSLEDQWKAGMAQVNQQGPMATDLMRLLTGAQGSMGIVVWASIKCELLPAVRKHFTVLAPRLEDLIDFCYKLERLRLGDEVIMLNQARLAAMSGRSNGASASLPPWMVVIGVGGAALYPQEKVDLQESELRKLAHEFGREMAIAAPEIAAICDAQDTAQSSRYDIFFLTTLDRTPGFVETVLALAARYEYPASRIGIYIQPQHQGVSQHVEFRLPFDPANKLETDRANRLFSAASEALIAQGAYFSRPYGSWADMVYSRDATATRVLRTVKQIVDANNIMNPGKLCF